MVNTRKLNDSTEHEFQKMFNSFTKNLQEQMTNIQTEMAKQFEVFMK